AFKKHAEAMRAGLRRAENSSAPENKQSLRATQLGLCAVMLATAKYGTTSALRSQFMTLDDFRDEIERRLVQHRMSYSDSLVLVARQFCVPDNRFQFNVLCLHAAQVGDARRVEKMQQLCAILPKSEVPIV